MSGYFRMRRDLRIPITAMAMPPEVVLEAFDPAQAGVCRDLMNRAYGEAGDEPVPVGAWYNTMVGDPQYDPSLIWVATSRSAVIGFCQCWRVPFVKDLVVESGWRRRGIGAALLSRALAEFADRGASSVDLKTDIDNVKAQSLYRRLGFVVVGENA